MADSQFELSEIKTFAQAYGVTNAKVERMHGGHTNTSYLLQTAEQQFVLTVFESDPYELVRIHAKLLNWLAEQQFAASPVVRTTEGTSVIVRQGRPILVKQFVEGSVCKTLDDTRLENVGRALATMHQLPCPAWLPKTHAFERLLPSVIENQIDRAFGAWVVRQVAKGRLISAELPAGLIHADIFWDNLVFNGKHLAAIIDFEHAMYGSFAFDLGMAIVGTCAVGKRVDLSKARALVRGYEQVRRLNELERASLQALTSYGAAMTGYWRFWRYCIDLISAENVNKYQTLVDIADQVQAVPKTRFLQAIWPEA